MFWAGGHIQKLNIDDGNARIIPFNVETEKKVQHALRFKQNVEADQFDVKMLRMAQVSPQGDAVIYEALGSLYQRSLPDGEPQRLTNSEDFELYPQYSRDGEKSYSFAGMTKRRQRLLFAISVLVMSKC